MNENHELLVKINHDPARQRRYLMRPFMRVFLQNYLLTQSIDISASHGLETRRQHSSSTFRFAQTGSVFCLEPITHQERDNKIRKLWRSCIIVYVRHINRYMFDLVLDLIIRKCFSLKRNKGHLDLHLLWLYVLFFVFFIGQVCFFCVFNSSVVRIVIYDLSSCENIIEIFSPS